MSTTLHQFVRSINRLATVAAVGLVLGFTQVSAQAYRSVQSGDWNQQTTWARSAATTGTITSIAADPNVVGVGTAFTTELAIGDQVYDNAFVLIGTVQTITDDNNLVLAAGAVSAATGSGFFIGRSFPQLAADQATVIATHTVALTSIQAITSLSVNATGVLSLNTAAQTLTLTGALTVNGDIAGTGAGAAVVMNGGNAAINASLSTTAALRFTAAGNLTSTGTPTINLLELDNVNVTIPAASTFTITNALVNVAGTPILTVTGTVTLSANNAVPGGTTLSVSAGGVANVAGTNAISATSTVTNAGTINFTGNTPIAVGATLDFATAANTVNFDNAASFALPVTTYRTLEIGAAGAKDLGGSTIVQDALTLNGVLNVLGNTLNLGNNTGAGALGGTITNLVTTAASSLEMRGTAAQVIPSSVTALNNLTLNNSAAGTAVSVTAAAQTVTVSGTYTMTDGDIDWNNNTLQLTGNFFQSGGTAFVSDAATGFYYNSAGTWFGFFQVAGGSDIGTFRFNATGGAVAPLASDVVVNTLLSLEAGELDINDQNLTVGGTAGFTRVAGSLIGSSTSGLIFTTTTAPSNPVVFTSTLELERLDINSAAITVQLGSTLTISGTGAAEGLRLTAGGLSLNGQNLSVTGNYARTSGSLVGAAASPSVVSFTGTTAYTQTLAVTGVTELGTLVINNTNANLTMASALTAGTDFSLTDGTFATGAFAFSAPGTASVADAFTVTALGSATFAGNSVVTATANVTNNGTLTFNGNTPIAVGATLNFAAAANTVTFNNAASFALPVTTYRTLVIGAAGAKDLGTGTTIVRDLLTLNAALNVAGNTLNLGDNATTFAGAIGGAAALNTTAASSLIYRGNAAQVIPSSVTALTNLTIQNNAAGTTVTMAAGPFTLDVSGTLALTQGRLVIATLAATANRININGTYTKAANGAFGGVANSTGIIAFNGTTATTQNLGLTGTTQIGRLIVNNANATLTLVTPLQTNAGGLELTAGNLGVGTQTLTVNGPYTRTAGNYVGGTGTLIYQGASTITGNTTFITTLTLGTLTLNNTNAAAQTVVLGSNLQVNTLLNMGLAVGATTRLNLNAFNLTVNGGYARFATSSTAFVGNAASSLIFSGATAITNQTIPFVTDLNLGQLTISNANANAIQLGSALNPANLTLTAGNLGLNGQSLDITFNYTRTGGFFVGSTTSNLSFSGAGTVTGDLAFVTDLTLNNFTLNKPGVTLGLGSTLQVNGTTTLTAGDLGLQDAADILTINGAYTRTGGNFVGGDGGLRITGTGAITGGISFITTQQLGELTINRAGFVLPLASDFTIRATGLGLILTAGDLDLNAFDLVVSGPYTRTAGNFIGDVASDLTFNGSGAATGTLNLITDLNLASLTVNRAATTFNLGTTVTTAALNLTAGNLGLNAQNLDVAGAYTRAAGNFVGNAASNLTFSGTGALGGQTLSFIAPNIVNDLVISNSTIQVFSLASNLEVDNTLNFANAAGQTQLQIGANTLRLSGNPIAGTGSNLLGGATSALTIAGVVAGHIVPSNLSTLRTLSILNSNAGGVGFTAGTLTVDSLILNSTATGFFAPAGGSILNVAQNITVTTGQIRLSGTSVLNHLGTSSVGATTIAFANTGTSTVNYNAAAPGQDVLNGQYVNLNFNNNAKTFVSAANANRTFNVAGDFNPGTGVHTLNGADIVMNGAVAQVVQDLNSTEPAGGYQLLRIANTSGGVTLTETTFVGDTLDLASGVFTVAAAQTLNINGTTAASGITLAAPTGGRTGTLVGANTSTVAYNRTGVAGQPIIRGDYANLTFTGAAKTLSNGGDIEVRQVFTPGALTTHVVTGSTLVFDGTTAQTLPQFNFTGAAGVGYNNVTIANTAASPGVTTGATGAGVAISGTLTNNAGSFLSIADNAATPLYLAGGYAGTGTLRGDATGLASGLSIIGNTAAPAITLPAISNLGYLEVDHNRAGAAVLGGTVTVNMPRATAAALRLRRGALNNSGSNVTLPADALILATGGTLTASPTYGATRADIQYANTITALFALNTPAGPGYAVNFTTGNELPASGNLGLVSATSSIQVALNAAGNILSQERNVTVPVNGTFTLTQGTHNIANGATPFNLNIQGDYARAGGSFDGIGTSNLTIGSGATSNVGASVLQVAGGAPHLGNLTLNFLDTETLNLANALALQGNLVLTSGNLGINGQVFTMGVAGVASGTITRTTGDLVGSNASTLVWLGTGNGQIPAGNNSLLLSTLTVNRTGGATITIGGTASVQLTTAAASTNLNLTAGTLTATTGLATQLIFNSGAAVNVTRNTITVSNNGGNAGYLVDPIADQTNAAGAPNWNGQHIDLFYTFTDSVGVTPYTVGREIPNNTSNALRRFQLNTFGSFNRLVLSKDIRIGSDVSAAPAVIGNSTLTLQRGVLFCNGFNVEAPALNTSNPLFSRTPLGSTTCPIVFNNNVNLEYIGNISTTGPEVPTGTPGIVNNLTVLLNAPTDVLQWVATTDVVVTQSVQLLRGVVNINNGGSGILYFGPGSNLDIAAGGCFSGGVLDTSLTTANFYFYKTPDASLTLQDANNTIGYSQCGQYRTIYIGQDERLPSIAGVPFGAIPAADFTVDMGLEVRVRTNPAHSRLSVTDLQVQADAAGARTGSLTTSVTGQFDGASGFYPGVVPNFTQVTDSVQIDNQGALQATINAAANQTLDIRSVITNITAPTTAFASIGDITSVATGTVQYSQAAAGQLVLGKATGIAAPTTFYGNLRFTGGVKTIPPVTIPYAGTFTPGVGTHTLDLVTANGALTGTSVMLNGTGAQAVPTFNTNVANGGGYFNLHLNRAAATANATLSGNVQVGDSLGATVVTAGQFILNMAGAGFDSLRVGANTLRVGSSVTRTAGALGAGSNAGIVWYSSRLPAGANQQLVVRGEYNNLRLNNFTKTFDGVAGNLIRVYNTFTPGNAATAHTTTGNNFEYGGFSTITVRALPTATGAYHNLFFANITAPSGAVDALLFLPGDTVRVANSFTMTSAADGATRRMAVNGRVNLNGARLRLNGTTAATVDFGDRARFVGSASSDLYLADAVLTANPLRFFNAGGTGADYTLRTLNVLRGAEASDLNLGSRLRIVGTAAGHGLQYAGANAAHEFNISDDTLELNGRIYWPATLANVVGNNAAIVRITPSATNLTQATRLPFEDASALRSLRVNLFTAADSISIGTRTQTAATNLTIGTATASADTFEVQQGIVSLRNRLVVQAGLTFGASGSLSGSRTLAALNLTGTSATQGARIFSGTLNFSSTRGLLAYVQSTATIVAIPLGSNLVVGNNSATSLFTMTQGVLNLNGNTLDVNGVYNMTANGGFRGSATSNLSFTGAQAPVASPGRYFRWVESAATEAARRAEFRLQSLTLNNANLDLDLDQGGSGATNRKLVLGDSTAALATALTFTNGNLDVTDGDTLVIGGQTVGTVGTLNSGAGGTGLAGVDAGLVRYSNLNAAQLVRASQYGFLELNGASKTFANATYSIAGQGSVFAFFPRAFTHVLDQTAGAGTLINYNGTAAQVVQDAFTTNTPNGASYLRLTLATTTGGVTLRAATGLTLTVGNHGNHAATNNGTLTTNMAAGGLNIQQNTLVINNAWTQTAGAFTVTNTGATAAQGLVNFNQQAFPFATQTLPAASFNYGNLTFSQYPKTIGAFTVGVGGVFNTDTDTVNSISTTGYTHTVTGSTFNFNGTVAQTVPSFNTTNANGPAANGYNNLTLSNSTAGTGQITLGGPVLVGGAYTMDPLTNNGTVVMNNRKLRLNGTINFGANGEAFQGSTTSDLYLGAGAITNNFRMVTTTGADYSLRTLRIDLGATNTDLTLGTRLRIVGTTSSFGLNTSGSAAGAQININGFQLEIFGSHQMSVAVGQNFNLNATATSVLRVQPAAGSFLGSLVFDDGDQIGTLRINANAAADNITVRTRTQTLATNLTVGNSAAADSFEVLQGRLSMTNAWQTQAQINFGTNGRLSGDATNAALRIQGIAAAGSRMAPGSQPIAFVAGGQRLAEFQLNVQTGRVIPLGSRLLAGDNSAVDRFHLINGILDLNGNHLEVNGRYRRDGANAYFRGSPASVLVFTGTQTASNATTEANDLRFQNGFQRLDSLVLNNTFALGGQNPFIDLDYVGATPANSRLYVGDSVANTGALVLTTGALNVTDGDTLQIGGAALRTTGNFNTDAIDNVNGGLITYQRQSANQPVLTGQYGRLLLNNSAKTFANGLYNIAGVGLAALSPGSATHDFDVTAAAGTRVVYNGTTPQIVRHNILTDVPAGGRYFGLQLTNTTAGAGAISLGGHVIVGDSIAGTGNYILNLTGVGATVAMDANRLTLSGPITNTAGTYTGGGTSELEIRGPAGAGAVPTFNFTAGAQELRVLRMARPTQTYTFGSNFRVGQAAGTGNLIIRTGATVAVGTNTLTIGNLTGDDVTSLGTWAGGTLSSAATGTVIYDRTAAGQLLIPAAYGNLTLNASAKTFRNGGTPAGTYGIANVFTPNAFTHDVTANPTVIINYNGTVAQNIAAFNTNVSGLPGDYPGLTLSSTGAKTFLSSLNYSVTNTYTMNVTGGTPTVTLPAGFEVAFLGPMTYTSGTFTGSATSRINIQGASTDAIANGTGWPFTVGSQLLENFTINRATQRFVLGSSLNMQATGTTAFDDGILGIGANNTLTISGIVTQANGRLAGSGTSDLLVNGTAATPGTILFSAGAGDSELRNFTYTRTGGSSVFTLGTPLSVGGTAGLGSLTIGGSSEVGIGAQNLTLTGGITLTAGGVFRGGTTSTLTVGGVPASIPLNIPVVTDNVQNMVLNHTRPDTFPTARLIAPLTVLNQVTFTAGVLGTDTLGNALTLGTNAATGVASPATGTATSFISGALRKFMSPSSTFIFPVGMEARWRRAEITTGATSTVNTPFTVSVIIGQPVRNSRDPDFTTPTPFNVSKVEQHRINAPAGGVMDRLVLHWGTSSIVSTTPSDWAKLFLVRWNGVAWDSANVGGRGSANVVNNPTFTINNGFVTSRPALGQTFSTQYYALASTDQTNPLPVTWLTFTGKWEDQAARLNWSTASELNNNIFIVERSVDQRNWTGIGSVPGSGTTNSVRRYTYLDTDVSANATELFYRIRQIDLDGTTTVSNTIALRRDGSGSADDQAFLIYPNPFTTGKLNIVGVLPDLEREGPFTFRIVSADGRQVASNRGDLVQVTELSRQALDRVEAGVYILVVESSRGVERHRLVKQ